MMPQIGNSTFGNDVFVSYIGETNSIAMGIDSGDDTFKISSSVTTDGTAIPSTNPNIIIDPASSGNVTLLPNIPSGQLVLNNGTFALPDSGGLPQGNITVGTAPFFTTGISVSDNSLFFGQDAGNSTTTGSNNTGVGGSSLQSITDGTNNTAIGASTLVSTLHGNNNIALGYQAGRLHISGNDNVYIANEGMAVETGFIRIGTAGTQTGGTFVTGINGVDLSTLNVGTIDAGTDQIGSATLTPGPGISIATAANAIVISSVGEGLNWNVVTSNTQAMAVKNGYISNFAGLITYTLPATAVVGDMMRITLINGAGSWTITQNAGQSIEIGSSSTTVTTGSLSSTAQGDSVELLCTVANTTFIVLSSMGNLTVL